MKGSTQLGQSIVPNRTNNNDAYTHFSGVIINKGNERSKEKKKKGETILYTLEYNINKIYRNVMTGHFLKALTTYHCHQVLHHQFPFQFLPSPHS